MPNDDWRDEIDYAKRQEVIENLTEKLGLPRGNPDETRRIIREIIGELSDIQRLSVSNNVTTTTALVHIKLAADNARRLIRELTQHIGVEY
jgi:hypothetical protein